jgi:sec-independent protein translocase protein TatA
MFGLGATELIVIAAIIFLIFGARRLPEIGKGLGQAIREFKHVKKEIKDNTEAEKPREEVETDKPDKDIPDQSGSIKAEIESLPGVDEIKTVTKTASQVRKWWKFVKN